MILYGPVECQCHANTHLHFNSWRLFAPDAQHSELFPRCCASLFQSDMLTFYPTEASFLWSKVAIKLPKALLDSQSMIIQVWKKIFWCCSKKQGICIHFIYSTTGNMSSNLMLFWVLTILLYEYSMKLQKMHHFCLGLFIAVSWMQFSKKKRIPFQNVHNLTAVDYMWASLS